MPNTSTQVRALFSPIVDALLQASRSGDTPTLEDLSAAIEVLALVAEGLKGGGVTAESGGPSTSSTGPQIGDEVWFIYDDKSNLLAVAQGPHGALPELIASCVALPFDGSEAKLTWTYQSAATPASTAAAFTTYACGVLKDNTPRWTGTMYGYSVGATTLLGTSSCP